MKGVYKYNKVAFYQVEYNPDKILEFVDQNDKYNKKILDHGGLSDLRGELQTCVNEYVDNHGLDCNAVVYDSEVVITSKKKSCEYRLHPTVFLHGIYTFATVKGSTPVTLKFKDNRCQDIKTTPGMLILSPHGHESKNGSIHPRMSITFNVFKENNLKWIIEIDKLVSKGELEQKDIVVPDDYEY